MEKSENQPKNAAIRNIEIRNGAVNSRDLLGGLQRIWIDHKSERYELRMTRQGKLILTK